MSKTKTVQFFHPVNNIKPPGLICYRADPCKGPHHLLLAKKLPFLVASIIKVLKNV